MRRFGSTDSSAMVIWLHGDVGAGGPANYHFAIAERAVTELDVPGLMSVALVRPGYPDGSGESSSVAFLHSGRSDHYTNENLQEVGAAIDRLIERFKPRTTILVGHSGGAATAAALLGMKPGFVNAAVLVACPCNIDAWRARRTPWGRSENPIKWADRVNVTSRVRALTGAKDDNTGPELARTYVETLQRRGIDATFVTLPDQTHNSAFRASEVIDAIRDLLARGPK